MTEESVRAMIASASTGKRVAMVFSSPEKADEALSLATKTIEEIPRLARTALYAPEEGRIYFDNGGVFWAKSETTDLKGMTFDSVFISEETA